MKNKSITISILVVALMSLLQACSSTREAADIDLPDNRVAIQPRFLDLLNKATQPAREIHSIEGAADVWIKTPEISQSMYCKIKIKRGEAIHIRGSVFFGITVLDALIRKDSIFIYNVFGGEVLIGENNAQNFERALMGMPFNFSQLTDAFLGLPSFSIQPDDIRSITARDGKIGYYLKGEQQSAIMIDSAMQTVESVQLFDSTGQKRAMANYREFEPVSVGSYKTLLPEVIEFISLPDQTTTLEKNDSREFIIVYAQRSLNPDDFSIEFQMPSGARVVELKGPPMQMIQP